MNILILSGRTILREALYNEIKDLGHKAQCWKSIEGLEEKIKKESFDLIVTEFCLFNDRDETSELTDGGVLAIEKINRTGSTIPFIFLYTDETWPFRHKRLARLLKMHRKLKIFTEFNLIQYPGERGNFIKRINEFDKWHERLKKALSLAKQTGLFEKKSDITTWFVTPRNDLGYKSPLDLLSTDDGLKKIEELFNHGPGPIILFLN